jgi:hypothetical protein
LLIELAISSREWPVNTPYGYCQAVLSGCHLAVMEAAMGKDKEPGNDNAAKANDNRPWKEKRAEWLRDYHREYMRKRREREREERRG